MELNWGNTLEMKLKNKIARITVTALTIWFFLPEFRLIYIEINNHINRNNTLISPYNEEKILFGQRKDSTFKFNTNRKVSEFDLNRSKITIFSSEDDKSIFSLFSNIKLQQDFLFSDPKITFSGSGNDITTIDLLYETDFNKNSPIISVIDIVDKKGNTSKNWIYSTQSPDVLSLFLARYIYYFQYLIWLFLIFKNRSKLLNWSVVYDTKTKQPINRAIIRVFNETNQLIDSQVTGDGGVIQIQLKKGKYRIEVVHSDYKFPSKITPQLKDDRYENLYYGKTFIIKKDNLSPKFNIPMDPRNSKNIEKTEKYRQILLSTITEFSPVLLLSYSFIQLILVPSKVQSYIIFIINITLIYTKYLMNEKLKRSYGILITEKGNPLPDIKVDIYDAQWNRLSKSILTDKKGRFNLILENKDYYLMLDSKNAVIDSPRGDGKYYIGKNKSGRMKLINPQIVVRKK